MNWLKIKISDQVRNEIIRRGKFGETTEEDVLRRFFGLPPLTNGSKLIRRAVTRKKRLATIRMTSKVVNNKLLVAFHGGPSQEWNLPYDKKNRQKIGRVRGDAIDFAKKNGATKGQVQAVIKALTSNGYYLFK